MAGYGQIAERLKQEQAAAEYQKEMERQANVAAQEKADRASILQNATSMGMEISVDEANALYDKYKSGDVFNKELALRDLERQYTENLNAKQKEEIERAVSPGDFLSDEEKTANKEQANTLLKSVYGQDYEDTEGLSDFVAERIAEGESAYELSQFLKTTTDYQTKKAEAESVKASEEATGARSALNEELLKTQQQVFERAQPSIISSYMKAGRLGSSGLNAALANAQKDLESERQSYLGNIAYQDYARQSGYKREDFVNSQAAGWNQYLRQNEPAYQQKFSLQGYGNQTRYEQPYANLARQYSLSDEARQRQYSLDDYAMQQSDFNRYLSDYRKQGRESAMYGLLGTALGTAGQFAIKKWA